MMKIHLQWQPLDWSTLTVNVDSPISLDSLTLKSSDNDNDDDDDDDDFKDYEFGDFDDANEDNGQSDCDYQWDEDFEITKCSVFAEVSSASTFSKVSLASYLFGWLKKKIYNYDDDDDY